MPSPIYEEYVDLLSQIEKLEEKKNSLQEQLIDEMENDHIKQKDTQFGSFFLMGRRTYIYSDKVKKIQEQMYQAKKEEEGSGVAILKSSTQHIRFMRNN